MNTEWVPEDVVLGKPRILGAAKMVAKCFLKNKAPFQCNKKTRTIKLKSTDQRFGLGYKPKKDDYKRVVHIRKEARMARIEGRELEEEEFVILLLQVSFIRAVEVIRSDIVDLHINTL